jgi:hypothetical protein
MTQTEKTLACVGCWRMIREGEAKAAGWFYWGDGENMHLVCSLCAARKFSADAPAASEA